MTKFFRDTKPVRDPTTGPYKHGRVVLVPLKVKVPEEHGQYTGHSVYNLCTRSSCDRNGIILKYDDNYFFLK